MSTTPTVNDASVSNAATTASTTATAASTTTTQRTLRPRQASRSVQEEQAARTHEVTQESTATGNRGQARGRGQGRAARGRRAATTGGGEGRQANGAPNMSTAMQSGGATSSVLVGNHPTVPQPIFTFVTAPKVANVSHEGMTRWLDLRFEYEEAIKARCKTTGEELDAVMTSVRNSFDESLLDTLCEAAWEMDKSDLTDDFLWDWIMKTVESFKYRTLPNIEVLFKRELSMDESQGDVEAQVISYFHSCNTLIRTNGLVGLFKTDDGLKSMCKILVNSLPAKLKKRVKNEIDFRAQGAKSSVPELFKLIMEQASDQEKIDRALRVAGVGGKRKQKYHESDRNSKANSFAPRKKQSQGSTPITAKYGSQDAALKSKVPHSKVAAAASSVAVSTVVKGI